MLFSLVSYLLTFSVPASAVPLKTPHSICQALLSQPIYEIPQYETSDGIGIGGGNPALKAMIIGIDSFEMRKISKKFHRGASLEKMRLRMNTLWVRTPDGKSHEFRMDLLRPGWLRGSVEFTFRGWPNMILSIAYHERSGGPDKLEIKLSVDLGPPPGISIRSGLPSSHETYRRWVDVPKLRRGTEN